MLAIVNSLEAVVGKRESHLILTCALNPGSPLTTAIREASGRTIETDDLNAQLAFIKEDLVDEPLLLYLLKINFLACLKLRNSFLLAAD